MPERKEGNRRMKRKVLAVAMSVSLAAASMSVAAFAEETSEAESFAVSEEAEEIATEAETAEEEAFDYSAGYDENGFFKDITALDYVTLPDYTGVAVPAEEVIPSESDIQAEIDNVLRNYTTTDQLTEGTVADGDTLNIDYVGSVDGVEFEGGSTNGQGTTVTIGVTQYIDDFLQQLVGHEVGENFDIEVTFPDPYQNADLAGKDAVFNITINYIEVTNIPELTDEFVSANLEFDTVDDYKQSIYDNLYEINLHGALLNTLIENAEVSEVPESCTETIYGAQLDYLTYVSAMYGLDVETYLSYVGYTEDTLREQCETRASNYLVLQAVMEDAALEITPEFFMEVTDTTEETYQSYVEFYGAGYVHWSVLSDCVARFMAESAAVIEDLEPETELATEAGTEAEAETAEMEAETVAETEAAEADTEAVEEETTEEA